MALRRGTFTNCCWDELPQKGAERPTATKAARATAEYGKYAEGKAGWNPFSAYSAYSAVESFFARSSPPANELDYCSARKPRPLQPDSAEPSESNLLRWSCSFA